MNNLLLKTARDYRLPLRIRRKIGKWLLGAVPAGQGFDLDILGQGKAIYHGQTGNHMDDKLFLYASHENATIRLIQDLLQEKGGASGAVYLDIGTNTGLHLTAAAPYCRAGYGFEPFELVRSRAEGNLAANHFDHMRVFPFGLSDQDAQLPYTPPQNDNLGTGHFSLHENIATDGNVADAGMVLSVRRGDDVMVENDIHPHVMKIDVEGLEPQVLRGLKHIITTAKPDIIFEYNTQTRRESPHILREILDVLGDDYTFQGILRSREYPKLVPFDPRQDDANASKYAYENILAQCRGR